MLFAMLILPGRERLNRAQKFTSFLIFSVTLYHQWLKFFFLNFEVKIGALVALYVWTIWL